MVEEFWWKRQVVRAPGLDSFFTILQVWSEVWNKNSLPQHICWLDWILPTGRFSEEFARGASWGLKSQVIDVFKGLSHCTLTGDDISYNGGWSWTCLPINDNCSQVLKEEPGSYGSGAGKIQEQSFPVCEGPEINHLQMLPAWLLSWPFYNLDLQASPRPSLASKLSISLRNTPFQKQQTSSWE